MKLIPSPAKLNLYLHILSQENDGYHKIESCMQYIDLYDFLDFELTAQQIQVKVIDRNAVTSLHLERPEQNLVYKAAVLIKQYSSIKQGVNIKIRKNIPTGAGLGGGSSNAATTLLALNKLWRANLSLAKLEQLGKQLGMDVVFFIQGNAAVVSNKGEQYKNIQLPSANYLLALPRLHFATKTMYSKLKSEYFHNQDSETITHNSVLSELQLDKLLSNYKNCFTNVAICESKQMQWLLDSDCAGFKLNGSGSSCFKKIDKMIPSTNQGCKLTQNETKDAGIRYKIVRSTSSNLAHKKLEYCTEDVISR